ncbi:DUF6941 family protein [Listeria newyorkensis]|uniref:Uncharacterized protein n=1 Tax=Listeria newyorkensis TaxID=1497681 RepID=A0A841YUE9_9LIST|nr:hypothetical protein [Listeria newyorkensis]MBC1456246.1 hypothetical protein [Listeria newyorkensis]
MARIASFICCKKTGLDAEGNSIIQSPITTVSVRKYPIDFEVTLVLTLCEFEQDPENTIRVRIAKSDTLLFDSQTVELPLHEEKLTPDYHPILTMSMGLDLKVEFPGQYEIEILFNEENIGIYPLFFSEGGGEDV